MAYDTSSAEVMENEYVLENFIKDKAMEVAIAGRNTLYWDEYQRFWQPALTKGRECFDYLVGNYFSNSELEQYRDQEKIVIKVPNLINKINSLCGMQINAQRDGIIIPQRGENAPDAKTMNYIRKSIQRENSIKEEKDAVFMDGMVTGYPCFMWYDKDYTYTKKRNLAGWHDVWDSTLPDPYFKHEDLSDTRRIIRIRLMDKELMKTSYPKRADVIEQEIREGTHPKDYFAQQTFSSNERNTLFQQINSAQDSFNQTGKMYVIESIFFVHHIMPVWWDTETGDYNILPPEWDEQQRNRWVEMNPNVKKVEKKVKTLWTTASAQSGLLLENNMHWFQTGEFPCEMFIPRMWNNKPYGLIEFLRGTSKAEAVARTEHLHSLRMVNDELTIIQEGSIKNAQDLTKEKGRIGGIVVTREGISADQAISFPFSGKREQMGWIEYAKDMEIQTDKLSTDPNFEGRVDQSQQSGKAASIRNKQTTNKFSPYLASFQRFDLRCGRKEIMMIPYIYTEQTVLRFLNDETKKPDEVEINKVVDRDIMTGAPTKIINNLNGAKYDYVESLTDNSVTAQEQDFDMFKEILAEMMQFIPDKSMWPALLMQTPSVMAQQFGMEIAEQMEKAAKEGPKPEPIKLNMSISGQDVAHNPTVQAILKAQGVLPQEAQSEVQAMMAAENGGGAPGQPQASPPNAQGGMNA